MTDPNYWVFDKAMAEKARLLNTIALKDLRKVVPTQRKSKTPSNETKPSRWGGFFGGGAKKDTVTSAASSDTAVQAAAAQQWRAVMYVCRGGAVIR